jgi:HPt (histidine-containing phosphotransfer) domain-containing protein
MLRRFGGDDGLLAEVLAEFSRNLPDSRACVNEAIKSGDAPALTVAAHRLRGALLEIAAFPSADLAQQLEACGHTDMQSSVELWSELLPLLSMLALDLDAWTPRP